MPFSMNATLTNSLPGLTDFKGAQKNIQFYANRLLSMPSESTAMFSTPPINVKVTQTERGTEGKLAVGSVVTVLIPSVVTLVSCWEFNMNKYAGRLIVQEINYIVTCQYNDSMRSEEYVNNVLYANTL